MVRCHLTLVCRADKKLDEQRKVSLRERGNLAELSTEGQDQTVSRILDIICLIALTQSRMLKLQAISSKKLAANREREAAISDMQWEELHEQSLHQTKQRKKIFLFHIGSNVFYELLHWLILQYIRLRRFKNRKCTSAANKYCRINASK